MRSTITTLSYNNPAAAAAEKKKQMTLRNIFDHDGDDDKPSSSSLHRQGLGRVGPEKTKKGLSGLPGGSGDEPMRRKRKVFLFMNMYVLRKRTR